MRGFFRVSIAKSGKKKKKQKNKNPPDFEIWV
jgi:hypothetical protein